MLYEIFLGQGYLNFLHRVTDNIRLQVPPVLYDHNSVRIW